MAQAAELSNDWTVLDQKLKTFNRLMTTKAAIGQTPKELIWTLNKAKLYRYIPVVPAEERYPIPLILIFALMNRPVGPEVIAAPIDTRPSGGRGHRRLLSHRRRPASARARTGADRPLVE